MTGHVRAGLWARRSLFAGLTLATLAFAGPAHADEATPPDPAPAVAPPDPAPAVAPVPPAPVTGIHTVKGDDGWRLQVDGKSLLVRGVNWDYFPIGTNYAYSLWTQPDDFIKQALDREMPLLKRMGANAIRVYTGIPARWITYIYDTYGIYTILNHTVGRYGYTIDGTWVATVDYSSPKFRDAVTKEILGLVDQYKGTPGLLMWLLGNENNYGLSWSSFEIEALPAGERDAARAKHLYSLFGSLATDIKARDHEHPVAIANGDLQYIDVIAAECKDVDILGVNAYRGLSMRDLYQVVHDKLDRPVMFTEFGADAFDAKAGHEDARTQAKYLVAQWREIYEQTAGKGKVGNAIGGTIFQWSDGWWKYKQSENLDVHDANASWPNGGYAEDFVEGSNNMNEEWWGICAKSPPDANGLYALQPRTAYYALQQAFRLDAYDGTTTPEVIAATFGAIDLDGLGHFYAADRALAQADTLSKVRLTNARMSFETYKTGGNARWQRPDLLGAGTGFDHTESFYATLELNPTEKVSGSVEVNVLGNVAQNPIDEIFYERRGKPTEVVTGVTANPDGTVTETTKRIAGDRVKVYKAKASWDDDWFHLDGFYRTGHYHWSAEGDLFGLYREANYGANVDIYDADAPSGIEVAGKRQLEGLKLAVGPQLWWGANPAVMAKYRHRFGDYDVTLLHQEDLAQASASGTSAAIPERSTRKTTLAVERHLGDIGLEVAGIWAGSNKVDDPFLTENGSIDKVSGTDALGAKAKVTYEKGLLHWYGQAAYMGLVADGGPDARITFTGWSLKDSGSGNQVNALTGVAFAVGDFQIAPNLLWQKPLVGPGPSLSGKSARNIVDDPFSVRANRETLAAELVLTYDPTPATWMYAWDNDLREDARFAASLDVAFRHMPTTLDAGFWFAADGVTRYAWDRGVPAADVWDAKLRMVSALDADTRIVGILYAGNQQANGQDPRQPHRYGGDVQVSYKSLVASGFAHFNDWGPFDYYRDFNSTLPLQLMADVAYSLGPVRWLWQRQTRIGLRGTSRYLNGYSGARYLQDPADPTAWGHEWEVRTYLVVTL